MMTRFIPGWTLQHFDQSAGEAAKLDADLIERFQKEQPWGLATSIDLGGCDPTAIRDPLYIESFVIALCHQIEVHRIGNPIIIRFGENPRHYGYSLVQLIETSLISGHFAETSDSAYIDIFSCKVYQPYKAAQFCRGWFSAEIVLVNTILRLAEVHQ